jgi:TRAP-type C4-dicarboxylate transport system permease small subunit
VPPTADRQALLRVALIRFAIIFGVLVFGALAWWTRDGRAPTPAPNPAFFTRLGAVPAVVMLAALAAVAALRVVWGRVREPARRRALSIVALAPGEAAALFGAIGYFLSGDSRWFLAGVFVLFAAVVLFPLRQLR